MNLSEVVEKLLRDFSGIAMKSATFEGDWVYAVTMCPEFDTYYLLKDILYFF